MRITLGRDLPGPLALHRAAAAALNPPHLQIQINANLPQGRSLARRRRRSYQPQCAVAHVPQGVFPLRTSVMSRACGSPMRVLLWKYRALSLDADLRLPTGDHGEPTNVK